MEVTDSSGCPVMWLRLQETLMECVSIILLVPGQLGVQHPLCLLTRQLPPGALIQMLVLEAFSQIKFSTCLSADINWQSDVIPTAHGQCRGKGASIRAGQCGKGVESRLRAHPVLAAPSTMNVRKGWKGAGILSLGQWDMTLENSGNSKYYSSWGSSILCVKGTSQTKCLIWSPFRVQIFVKSASSQAVFGQVSCGELWHTLCTGRRWPGRQQVTN